MMNQIRIIMRFTVTDIRTMKIIKLMIYRIIMMMTIITLADTKRGKY